MALPISGTKIVSVLKPNVGETAPAEVKLRSNKMMNN